MNRLFLNARFLQNNNFKVIFSTSWRYFCNIKVDAKDQEFIHHLKKNGFISDFLTIGERKSSNHSKNGNKGVFTLKDVEKNRILAIIPKHLILNKENSLSTTIGSKLPWPTEEDKKKIINSQNRFRSFTALTMLLLHLRDSKLSLWKPWIDILPLNFTNGITISLDSKLMQYTQGMNIELEIQELRKHFDESLKFFREQCGNYPGVFPNAGNEAYLWSWSSIMSRSLLIKNEPSLIPFIDFVNFPEKYGDHSVELRRDSQGNILIQSLKDIPAYTEIFINQFTTSNSEFLAMYGYTQTDSPYQLKVSCAFPPELLKGKGAEHLIKSGIKPTIVGSESAQFDISFTFDTIDEKIGTELLPIIRWLSLDDIDVESILKQDTNMMIEDPVPDEHLEINIAVSAYEAMKARLTSYPTTLEFDQKVLQSTKEDVIKEIVRCRIEEHQVFKKLVDTLHDHLHVLQVQHSESHPHHHENHHNHEEHKDQHHDHHHDHKH